MDRRVDGVVDDETDACEDVERGFLRGEIPTTSGCVADDETDARGGFLWGEIPTTSGSAVDDEIDARGGLYQRPPAVLF